MSCSLALHLPTGRIIVDDGDAVEDDSIPSSDYDSSPHPDPDPDPDPDDDRCALISFLSVRFVTSHSYSRRSPWRIIMDMFRSGHRRRIRPLRRKISR